MKESILHYVWQNKLFTAHDNHTTDGETIEVVDVGRNNTDAGPDFFNAKIRIADTLWLVMLKFIPVHPTGTNTIINRIKPMTV